MGSYFRPSSLPDALAALAARPLIPLAGGTDHYPARVIQTPDEAILDITGGDDIVEAEAGRQG